MSTIDQTTSACSLSLCACVDFHREQPLLTCKWRRCLRVTDAQSIVAVNGALRTPQGPQWYAKNKSLGCFRDRRNANASTS